MQLLLPVANSSYAVRDTSSVNTDRAGRLTACQCHRIVSVCARGPDGIGRGLRRRQSPPRRIGRRIWRKCHARWSDVVSRVRSAPSLVRVACVRGGSRLCPVSPSGEFSVILFENRLNRRTMIRTVVFPPEVDITREFRVESTIFVSRAHVQHFPKASTLVRSTAQDKAYFPGLSTRADAPSRASSNPLVTTRILRIKVPCSRPC